MSPTEHSENVNSVSDNDALLQIHLAEYQALTNRCTYWISIQFALLPLFLVVVGIVAQMWTSYFDRRLLLLLGMLISELIVIIWIHIGEEIYRTVVYVECKLRPLVRESASTSRTFWAYEASLAARRGRNATWEEYIMPVLCFCGLLAITVWFWPLSGKQYLWLGGALMLLGVIVAKSWTLVATRREFTKCH
jgi:hypothetical protein